MPIIQCDECGRGREIMFRSDEHQSHYPPDKIRGVFVCYKEESLTPFEMTGNVVTFKPGGGIVPSLSASVPNEVQERYQEAQLCWYGSAPRGATVMARATVEDALKLQGISKPTLELSIDEAQTQGKLDSVTHGMAHASRLVGNAAIHQADKVEMGDVPPILTVAARVVNHLYP